MTKELESLELAEKLIKQDILAAEISPSSSEANEFRSRAGLFGIMGVNPLPNKAERRDKADRNHVG